MTARASTKRDPFDTTEPGHLGVAAMRERAELLDGELEIESGDRGTRVVVRVPPGRRPGPRQRRPWRAPG